MSWRRSSDGHAVELELLHASPESLDWVVLTPPPVFIDEVADRGVLVQWRAGPSLLVGDDPEFSFADLAAAAVDEIEVAHHHRTQVALARL